MSQKSHFDLMRRPIYEKPNLKNLIPKCVRLNSKRKKIRSLRYLLKTKYNAFEEMLIGDPDGFHGPIDEYLIENRQLELATHLLEYDMPVENENLMSVEDEILLASTREIRMLQQALTDQNLRELDNDFPDEESASVKCFFYAGYYVAFCCQLVKIC